MFIHSQGRAATGCRSTPGTRSSPTGDTWPLLISCHVSCHVPCHAMSCHMSRHVTFHDPPRVPASTWVTSPSSTWMTRRTGSPWSTTRPPCSPTRAARSSSTAARTGTGSSVTGGYGGNIFHSDTNAHLICVFCRARNVLSRSFHNHGESPY